MQYEGYMTCRYYTINVNFQLTQRYQIHHLPIAGYKRTGASIRGAELIALATSFASADLYTATI